MGNSRKLLTRVLGEWRPLRCHKEELRVDIMLTTGQSFRWFSTGQNEWTGVLRNRVVRFKQTEDDVLYCTHDDPDLEYDSVVRNYLNLEPSLSDLYKSASKSDPRFASIAPYFPGVRVLRQDPVECLFSFICSSNNNIARITKLVNALADNFGDPIGVVDGCKYYAFPTLSQLGKAKEQKLRDLGFGYRAKFIVDTTATLKRRGGEDYLLGLRSADRVEARSALTELTGVGLKVASCVCLFSLDKCDEVPIDVHVWRIAVRDYMGTTIENKTLTPRVYDEVGDFFRAKFCGGFAGWAHNVLFLGEISSFKTRLPPELQLGKLEKPTKESKSKSTTKQSKAKHPKIKTEAIKQEYGDGDNVKSKKKRSLVKEEPLDDVKPLKETTKRTRK